MNFDYIEILFTFFYIMNTVYHEMNETRLNKKDKEYMKRNFSNNKRLKMVDKKQIKGLYGRPDFYQY